MKLNTVIRRIPHWYAAKKCVYLKSPPGRGKTTVFCEAPKLLSERLGKRMGLVVINGPLLTPMDSIGYLVPKQVEGRMESQYTEPFWWRTSEGLRLNDYDGGIIVVDEADKMDSDVKKVIGEAALSGRLGPHELPEGWLVWMAGNRAEDRSGSTKELDHLINRRIEIDITDDLESWTDWCMKNDVPPLLVAWGNSNPQIVFSQGVPEKQGPWCTPRSAVAVGHYLRELGATEGTIPEDPDTLEEVSGMIGGAAAASLFATVRLDREMPKFERIVAAPMEAKVPQKADAQMLVCYNLAHRVDLDTAEAVSKYVSRMPKEFTIIFMTAACKRNFKLIESLGFQKWIHENGSLMAAITKGTTN